MHRLRLIPRTYRRTDITRLRGNGAVNTLLKTRSPSPDGAYYALDRACFMVTACAAMSACKPVSHRQAES